MIAMIVRIFMSFPPNFFEVSIAQLPKECKHRTQNQVRCFFLTSFSVF